MLRRRQLATVSDGSRFVPSARMPLSTPIALNATPTDTMTLDPLMSSLSAAAMQAQKHVQQQQEVALEPRS